MPTQINVPAVGESIKSVYVADWKKNTGEYCNAGDIICEIETDKASQEIPTEVAGVITTQAKIGDELPIGGVLDNVYAEPLVVTAVVEALFDGSCRIVGLSRFVALAVSLTWAASPQTTSSGATARASTLSCKSARLCGCFDRRAATTPGCA